MHAVSSPAQPRTFSLSFAALDVLGQTLGLNLRHFPLEIPSFGQFEEDRLRIAKAVFTDLGRRGLIRSGRVDRDVDIALRLFDNAGITIAVLGTVADQQITARLAAVGEHAVVAVERGQTVHFELVTTASLARGAVRLLPDARPGPGQSVSVAMPPAERTGEGYRGVPAPIAATEQQRRIAQGMLDRPRTGSGFFLVHGRGRHGRSRLTGSLNWIDTDAGRYLMLSRPTEDGATRGTCSPADNARLTQHLAELVDAAAGRPAVGATRGS